MPFLNEPMSSARTGHVLGQICLFSFNLLLAYTCRSLSSDLHGRLSMSDAPLSKIVMTNVYSSRSPVPGMVLTEGEVSRSMDRLIPTTEIKSEIHIKLDPDLLPPNTSFKIKKEEPDLGRTPSPNPRDRERFEDEFVEVDSGSDSEAEEAVDPNFEGFVEEGGQKYFVSKGVL